MVLGYHIILSACGFWLPNDPRGSWSDTMRVYDLLRFGPATKLTTTRSVAPVDHDPALRLAAKRADAQTCPIHRRSGLKHQHWKCVTPFR